MAQATITKFIVDGEEFFAAYLNDGGIRVGLKGSTIYNINESHRMFAAAAAVKTEADAEDVLDQIIVCAAHATKEFRDVNNVSRGGVICVLTK